MNKNEQVNTISKGQLEKAIQNNYGIKTLTAKELKICRNTLNKYIEKHNLSEFLEEQREVIRDLVRLNIVKAIEDGDLKVTLWYAERQMFEEFGNRSIQELKFQQEREKREKELSGTKYRITDDLTPEQAGNIYKEIIRMSKE